MKSHVIGIAGMPGSGKTTVTRALAAALGAATAVHMDDYEQMTRLPVEQVADWMARGADVDELPVPLLDEHLAALKAGRAVTAPGARRATEPARWIVFETQFGRAHRATGEHIDLLVWLEIPREVALARTLLGATELALAVPDPALRERVQWMRGFLANYLNVVRELAVWQREAVMPGADLVVDAALDPRDIVVRIRAEAQRRFGAGG